MKSNGHGSAQEAEEEERKSKVEVPGVCSERPKRNETLGRCSSRVGQAEGSNKATTSPEHG